MLEHSRAGRVVHCAVSQCSGDEIELQSTSNHLPQRGISKTRAYVQSGKCEGAITASLRGPLQISNHRELRCTPENDSNDGIEPTLIAGTKRCICYSWSLARWFLTSLVAWRDEYTSLALRTRPSSPASFCLSLPTVSTASLLRTDSERLMFLGSPCLPVV